MHIKKLSLLLATGALLVGSTIATDAEAGYANPTIGEVIIMPYTFCPRGYASAEGQLLPINQYQALFSLYGTTFGGDGRTTFGLPDLRGRSPMGIGSGPGLTTRTQGQQFGTETNTMTVAQMPTHSHRGGLRTRANETANSTTPRMNSFADTVNNTYIDGTAPTGKFMNSGTVFIEDAGGSQPQNNTHPVTVLRYCVALTGIYPSRN